MKRFQDDQITLQKSVIEKNIKGKSCKVCGDSPQTRGPTRLNPICAAARISFK